MSFLTSWLSPRGCVPGAEQLLAEYGVKLAVADQRYDGAPLEYKFDSELTTLQKEAARALLAHDAGVFVGPPGIGKTVLGAYVGQIGGGKHRPNGRLDVAMIQSLVQKEKVDDLVARLRARHRR